MEWIGRESNDINKWIRKWNGSGKGIEKGKTKAEATRNNHDEGGSTRARLTRGAQRGRMER